MNSTGPRAPLASAIAAVELLSRDPSSYLVLGDDALLDAARQAAVVQRLIGATAAAIAGEIARRSAVSLGHDGLAQRTGHRTAIELVRVTTGLSGRDAAASVRVGALVLDAADSHSWLHSLGQALGAGTLSVAAADSIRAGLGEPSPRVSEDALAEATERLCAESTTLDADRLFRRARELRGALDEASVAEREIERREARSLTLTRLPDGMSRLTWLMDPETAAITADLWDRATSPRRGGPRFVDAGSTDFERAKRITDDPRSTAQLASDVFVELLRQGAATDASQLLGSGAPVVHLLVLKSTLDESRGEAAGVGAGVGTGVGTGRGYLEGQLDPVSIETIQRALCSSTIEPILFDDSGHALDVGREQRHYTRKQRRALAIRDGGCMFPGCDRPPSWTEAHHTKHWTRDRGGTNIDDGILLCRHHHLLCHNNHWEIRSGEGGFVLIPPIDVDPDQVPIPLPSKSAALRELRAVAR
ncbi:MAG: DUF222 domain-containing protein [Actinomycetota bacterium]